MEIDLTGQRILVTGSSRGIGLGIAKLLLESGATVIAHARRERETLRTLKEEYPQRCELAYANLENFNATVEMLDDIFISPVTGIVNNAAIAIESDPKKPDTQWWEDWTRTMNVNTNAVGLICKRGVEHFLKHGGGRFVNISSRAAFRGDTPEFLAYGTSKAGMLVLARSIARYYGKQGVKAFNIAPGFTRTEMAQDFIDKYGEDYAMQGVALNELTTPGDIAPTVTFLLSGFADHATGSTIDINAASYVH